MNEITITVIPDNDRAKLVMPENTIRKFPATMRISEIEKAIRQYFKDELFMGNGEEYSLQARIPANHPDAFAV